MSEADRSIGSARWGFERRFSVGDVVHIVAYAFIAGTFFYAFNSHLNEPYHDVAGDRIAELTIATERLLLIVEHTVEDVDDIESAVEAEAQAVETKVSNIRERVRRLEIRNGGSSP